MASTPSDHDADHTAIDALGRRAGAAVRQAAPADLLSGIRRAHRRRQAVRGTVAAAGMVALVAAGVLVFNGRNDARTIDVTDSPVTTASVPTTASPTVVSTDAVVASPSSVAVFDTSQPVPSVAPSTTLAAGADPDGIPDVVYGPIGDWTSEWVIDPISREMRDTIPFGQASAEPAPPRMTSASGHVTYSYRTTADGGFQTDACGQGELVVSGAQSSLPSSASVTLSPDGRIGLVAAAACPEGERLDDVFDPVIPYDVGLALFDPEQPDAATVPIMTLNRADEELRTGGVLFSEDGSYVIVATNPIAKDPATGRRQRYDNGNVDEGLSYRLRLFDVATATQLGDSADRYAALLPHGDCIVGVHGLEWETSTIFSYAASCLKTNDGFHIVIVDAATREVSDVKASDVPSGTEDVGTGYDIDRSTLTSPSGAWYTFFTGYGVVGEEYQAWIGRGDGPPLPIAVVSAAWFTPR